MVRSLEQAVEVACHYKLCRACQDPKGENSAAVSRSQPHSEVPFVNALEPALIAHTHTQPLHCTLNCVAEAGQGMPQGTLEPRSSLRRQTADVARTEQLRGPAEHPTSLRAWTLISITDQPPEVIQ